MDRAIFQVFEFSLCYGYFSIPDSISFFYIPAIKRSICKKYPDYINAVQTS